MIPIVQGAVELLLLTLASLALGRRLLKFIRCTISDVEEHALFAIGLGLASLQIVPFALFAAGCGTTAAFRICSALLGLLLMPDAFRVVRAGIGRVRRIKIDSRWMIAAIAGLSLLLILQFMRSVCPPFDGDPISYHITVAVRYLNAHRFVYLPTITYSNWPLGEQMLFALLMGIHRGSPVAIVQFLFGIIAFCTAGLFARRIAGGMAGSIAVVLMMAYGTLVQQMHAAFIDIGLTACSGLAVFALYRFYEERSTGYTYTSLGTLAALFGGMAATIKLTGIWTIVSLLAVILLLPDAETLPIRLRTCLRLGAVSLLVVAPWFVKTWLLTGNPVYPLAFSIFGGIEWSAAGTANFTFGHMIWNTPPGMQPTLQVLFWSHIFNTVVGAAVCFVAVRLSRRSRLAIPICWAALFTLCICAANYFHPRFLMPAVPLLFVAAACALVGSSINRLVIAPACGAVSVAFALLQLAPANPSLKECLRVAIGAESKEELLSRHMPDYAITKYANGHLPPDARILIGTYANNLAYYDAEALWPEWWEQDSIHYDSQARLEQDLRRLKVEYLVLDPDFPDWCDKSLSCRMRKEREPVALSELARQCGTQLFSANGHTLYRLALGTLSASSSLTARRGREHGR